MTPNLPTTPSGGQLPPSLAAAPLLCKRCGIPLVPSRACPGFYAHTEKTTVRHYAVPFRVPA